MCHYLTDTKPQHLMCWSYLGNVFKSVKAEISLLNSSCSTIGDLSSVVSLAQK